MKPAPATSGRTIAGCLPTEQQRLILRAACLDGPVARSAWTEWRSQTEFNSADVASTRLLPWIYLRREELGVSKPDAEALNSHYRFVWLRNQIILNRCPETLRPLRLAGVDTMLLKGVPLLLEFYRDEGARSMEDFDVLVRENQAEQAVEALTGAGWKPLVAEKVTASGRAMRHSHGFTNSEGDQCDLHWQLMPRPYVPASEEPLWQARQPAVVRGEPTSLPCPEHMIVHLLVHGMIWEKIPPIRWMLDVHRVLATARLNWNLVFEEATRRRLLLPVAEALRHYESILPGQLGEEVKRRLDQSPPDSSQHQAYELISQPYEQRRWQLRMRTLLGDWKRARASGQARGGATGFTHYLCHRWGVDAPKALPMAILRKLARKLRD